jgi:cutinase
MKRHRHLRRGALGATAAAGLVAVACTNGGGSTIGRPCTDVELVVARGTGEPGTLGVIVGDPLLRATRAAIAPRTVAGHPVDYPASAAANSAITGNRALVEHLTRRAAACANTAFVLVGYSQGSSVVNMSLGVDSRGRQITVIPATLEPRVKAIVQFGNPLTGQGGQVPPQYRDRVLDICATGDPVCDRGGGNIGAHLTYSGDAQRAAQFIRSKTM